MNNDVRKPALLLLFFLLFFFTVSARAQEAAPFTVTDYLEMTWFSDIQTSPDGRHVAFITTRNNFLTDRRESTVWNLVANANGLPQTAVKITREAGQFSELKWSADSRYFAFKSIGKSSKAQLVVADAQTTRLLSITNDQRFAQGISSFDWSADGRQIYFAVKDVPPLRKDASISFPPPPEPDDHTTFYRLPIARYGQMLPQRVISIEDSVAEFALSPDEKRIAYRPSQAIWLINILGDRTPRRLTPRFPCLDPGFKWTPRGILIQGCGGMKGGGIVRTQRRIYWVDPNNGHMQQLAPDFTGELWAQTLAGPDDVLAIGNLSTQWSLYSLGTTSGQTRKIELSTGPIRKISVAANGRLVAFAKVDDSELYVANSIDRLESATKVTALNAKTSKLPKPEVETIRWKNNDGDTIEGVVYFPPGKKEAKELPLILAIHGGPWIARTESFYTPLGGAGIDDAAVVASRGYLVLMPNYRGSTGRGDAFLQALDGYPCSRPSADVLTGVDEVVRRGWADPSRMGVYGGSYGGRITNCVIGLDNRFKAAVSAAGFWNLTSAISGSGAALAGFGSIKPPWEDITKYWNESPISHAGNIKTPTLIIIGGADTAVNPNQAREQKRAFDWLEVPSELLIFPGDEHEMSRPSSTRTRLEAEIAWFDHYLLQWPLPKPKE